VDVLEGTPEPPALSCPRGHGEKPGKFCSECGFALITPSPPGEHVDIFMSALAGASTARQEAVSHDPRVTVTSRAAEQWTREPMHDPRVTEAILAGKDAATVALITRNVTREYAERAAAGGDVIGPRRGTAWMTPSQMAREGERTLGASMLPSESMQPRGSAVQVTEIPAAEREAAEFTWGVQPGGGPATARCESGHEMAVEASACGVCGAAQFDEHPPDLPLPPSPYPAELGIIGGR
jgi:hypothetical protein